MPFVLLLLVALTVGSLVTVLAAHYPHTAGVSQPSDRAAAEVGHVIAEHERLRRLRRHLRGRLDPTTATGLALSLALLVILVAGIVIGSLAYLIRANSELAAIDRGVGQWGVDHRYDWSTDALQLFTWLGDTRLIVPLALAVAIVEYVRRPSRWIVPFLVAVVAGNVLLVNGIKDVLDRVRPEFNPIAETLGPSFPSGHSAGAAAFLVRGRTARHPGPYATPAGADPRPRGGDRRGRRLQPRHARRPLGLGRRRGSAVRLGVVLRVQHRLRRPPAPVRRAGREGCRGRGRGDARAAAVTPATPRTSSTYGSYRWPRIGPSTRRWRRETPGSLTRRCVSGRAGS